jgi:Ca-activated chloride channel family protein
MIRQNLGAANLFPFGIGTSINRHLIEGMARAGMGEPFIVLNRGEAPQQAARFRQYINNPLLTDIKLSFEGFEAYEVEPGSLPDLFTLRPLTLLGKYRGSPTGAIVVKGKTAKGDFERRIELKDAQAGPANSALRLLWARQRLMHLADINRLTRGQDDGRIQEITALGLKYSLMTAYTSFVAVDKLKRADGQVVTVKQPLPLPEGVSDLAVGGGPRGLKAKASKGGFASMPYSPAPTKAYDLAARLSEPAQEGAAPATGKPEEAQPSAPSIKVAIQITQTKGGLKAAAIKKTLEANLARLISCCEDYVKRGGQLPSAITLTFTLGPDGKVSGQVLAKPLLAPEKLSQCLGQTIQGILFPNPGKKTGDVTVKLVLTQ